MRDAATSSAAGKASAELSLAGNALEVLQTHDETMHMKDRTTTVNGVAQADRELVADEFAATAGEDGRTACETCPLLLAAVGREPPDEAVVWQYAQANRGAVASGGIGCGSREIDPESRGDGGVSDKTGWEGRGQRFWNLGWAMRTLCRAWGPAPKRK